MRAPSTGQSFAGDDVMLGEGFEDLQGGYGDEGAAHGHGSSSIGALVSDMMRGVSAASGGDHDGYVEIEEIEGLEEA